jgi:hypothetical protein
MQDKEAIFDSVDTAKTALEIFAEMIDGEYRAKAARRFDPNLLPGDLADRLGCRQFRFAGA